MKTPELSKAMAAFQGEMPEIKLDATVKVKTRTGGTYDFQYATLQNIMKRTLPVLAKNGLSIMQIFTGEKLKTILMHSSGEQRVSVVPIDLHSGNMQEIGSRISYLKRYTLTAMLGIVAEEDDDANIDSGNQFQYKPAPQKKAQKGSAYKKYLVSMANIKKEVEAKTGALDIYYNILKKYNVKHANEIRDVAIGRNIWREISKALGIAPKPTNNEPPISDFPDQIPCPEKDGGDVPTSACDACKMRKGCPSWEELDGMEYEEKL